MPDDEHANALAGSDDPLFAQARESHAHCLAIDREALGELVLGGQLLARCDQTAADFEFELTADLLPNRDRTVPIDHGGVHLSFMHDVIHLVHGASRCAG